MRRCGKCGGEIPSKVVVDGRERNLQRRKYCLTCSPFGGHNTAKLERQHSLGKPCEVCGLPANRSDRPNSRRCASCNTRIRRYRVKIALVEMLGGQCARCGWRGPLASYDLHHRDPAKKSFALGMIANRAWDVVKEEAQKCELLCANCHRIEHSAEDEKIVSAARQYRGKKYLLG